MIFNTPKRVLHELTQNDNFLERYHSNDNARLALLLLLLC